MQGCIFVYKITTHCATHSSIAFKHMSTTHFAAHSSIALKHIATPHFAAHSSITLQHMSMTHFAARSSIALKPIATPHFAARSNIGLSTCPQQLQFPSLKQHFKKSTHVFVYKFQTLCFKEHLVFIPSCSRNEEDRFLNLTKPKIQSLKCHNFLILIRKTSKFKNEKIET